MPLRLRHSNIFTWLSLPSLIYAITLDCKDVRVDSRGDSQSFNLGPLGGPHSVHWIQETPPSVSNFTFTIDICQGLKRTKGVSKDKECPTGTRVCGIEYDYNPADDTQFVRQVRPIAGDYTLDGGRPLNPRWTRLKNSDSHADANKEGLRLELNGGQYPFEGKGQPQKAFVEFICDKDRDGLEGDEGDKREKEEGDESEVSTRELNHRRDESDDDGDHDRGEDNKKKSLRFISYKSDGEDVGVLRLEWLTKYACEATETAPDASKSGRWGFFTWFIIILFLAVASYLIFGSWMNYNRYGARGWDLLPHGDTIRDIPYLLKDWARRVVSTFSSDSRGGYSAV